MAQTSSNVVAGNDAKASDHNKVVADLAEIYSGGPGVPVGGVIYWWSDNTIPLNYKECNGQTISDGSSPLNGLTVPNITDRMIRGVANANVRTTPVTGGEDSKTLSTAEIPSHTHGVNDPGHTHSAYQNPHNHRVSAGGGFGAGPGNAGLFRVDANSPATIWSNGSTDTQQPGVGVNANGTGISLQNTGGGTAFSMIPRYVGLVPVIRYK